MKQDYAKIKTDALDETYTFSSEAYSETKQPLPTFYRSKLFSWATDNNDFPDKEFAIVLVSHLSNLCSMSEFFVVAFFFSLFVVDFNCSLLFRAFTMTPQ